jgi:hypothetical protein
LPWVELVQGIVEIVARALGARSERCTLTRHVPFDVQDDGMEVRVSADAGEIRRQSLRKRQDSGHWESKPREFGIVSADCWSRAGERNECPGD